ncbi:hypothetical protein [uncultured Shewanella sp.]|uniref:hypothetical protein n=1 Tax=uncultured Shewanella sp. TaxID=173975 RepID=UPI002628EB6C|nr:hypothetical protein [uncultured Shewanella sp.]
MRNISHQEKNSIIGGKKGIKNRYPTAQTNLGTSAGAATMAHATGNGRIGCAVLGTLSGAATRVITAPAGPLVSGYSGPVVSGAVTYACNNRPTNYQSRPSSGISNRNRYWPN